VTDSPQWVPVVILFGLLLLAYLAMWRGWRRRARKHALPSLVAAPPSDDLPAARLYGGGRYFGTTVNGDWLDRVVAQGLGTRSPCSLFLSDEGLDVLRPRGSFRIPTTALRGARQDQGIAGKVMPPHGVLVVTWEHGDYLLDSGFRLDPTEPSGGGVAGATRAPDTSARGMHEAWVEAIERTVKEPR
jgi:hypothetical protein